MELKLKISCNKADIKSETDKLRQEIDLRKSEIEILRHAIGHYQKQCDHKGQQTGYNERSGSWGGPVSDMWLYLLKY